MWPTDVNCALYNTTHSTCQRTRLHIIYPLSCNCDSGVDMGVKTLPFLVVFVALHLALITWRDEHGLPRLARGAAGGERDVEQLGDEGTVGAVLERRLRHTQRDTADRWVEGGGVSGGGEWGEWTGVRGEWTGVNWRGWVEGMNGLGWVEGAGD